MRDTDTAQTISPTAAHTPGPWRYEMDTPGSNYARIWMSGPHDGDIVRGYMGEANARLIAAAPETAAERDKLREVNAELLKALRSIEQRADCAPHDEPASANAEFLAIRNKARAAIAKAEGRE